ncbi:hypothetical protein EYC84_001793 [Monilinia fructicola]|uniref:Uncharacterized protein n=1 Tax=Monilinia fructicola TaxID=38448 RepID=A0A5M9JQN4_MONFR|nr:hypothetical protein EYC84_001793 [Monilinia fructicola]
MRPSTVILAATQRTSHHLALHPSILIPLPGNLQPVTRKIQSAVQCAVCSRDKIQDQVPKKPWKSPYVDRTHSKKKKRKK